MCMTVATIHAADETGFVNIVNGTGQDIRLMLDRKVIIDKLAPGSMTGGLSIPVGRASISATADGLKDASEPITVEKDVSLLAVVGLYTTMKDPPEDVLQIHAVPYQPHVKKGFSASLIYAGKRALITVKTHNRVIVLEKYKYTDLGSISRSFSLQSESDKPFVVSFDEPLHYTLVILDAKSGEQTKVLVVPNVKYAKPTF